MNSLQILQIVVASAAGWALLVLALDIVYHLDLRTCNLLSAAGWVLVGCAGGWLGLIPGVHRIAPEWPTTIFAVSLSFCGWANRQSLLAQAIRIRREPSSWQTWAVGIAAAGAVAAPAAQDADRNPDPAMRPATPSTIERRSEQVTSP